MLLQTRPRILRTSCFLFLAYLIFPLSAQTTDGDPKNAVGWFQRASDQMNPRTPGAAPFHMKVTFTAFPGLELLDKSKSQIMTGDGVYEETWLATHHWRREVTLGAYHAVEVESDAGRKMQASSDYEPSRVLMMLDALLYPIQRNRISPALEGHHQSWTIERKTAGDLSYVLISAKEDSFGVYRPSYVFLPGGLLVQSSEGNLVDSWEDDTTFATHVVPKRLRIQAGGRDILTAQIAIQPAGEVDPSIFELPGESATPGMTLRPLHLFDVRVSDRQEVNCMSAANDSQLLPLVVREAIDRHGVARDVELLDSRKLDETSHSQAVAGFLNCFRGHKDSPAMIDKSPAQIDRLIVLIARR